MVLLKPALLE